MTQTFTPALGHAALTPLYDGVVALMTREKRWRRALLGLVEPQANDTIFDVGCGTGTFALMLKQAAPDARIVGIDPDRDVLVRARAKATRLGAEINFVEAFARDAARVGQGQATKIVSSLVFHQVPLAEKQAGLRAMYDALPAGGALHIADYGWQRTALMRSLFKQVQRLDGFANTQPNADGVLPRLIKEAGFADVAEVEIIPTPTGSISLYSAKRTGTAP